MLTTIAQMVCSFLKICFQFSREGKIAPFFELFDYFPMFCIAYSASIENHFLSPASLEWDFHSSLLQSPCKWCVINIPSWTQSRRIYCGFLKHLGYPLKDFEESDSWTVWSIQPEMLPKRNYHIIILFFPETQSLRNNVILYSIMQRREHYSHKTSHCLVVDKNYLGTSCSSNLHEQ